MLPIIYEGSKVFLKSIYQTVNQLFNTNNYLKTDEAMQILNIDEIKKEKLENAYRNLYNKNQNVSPYIQKKIKNAYLFLKEQL